MTKVVFITGASSGIGYAAALAFAQAGYQVAGTARRIERLEQLQQEIGVNFLPLAGDVTDAESVQAAVTATVERFGRLDVLVANAGVGHRGALVDTEWDAMETLLRTNMDGVLHSIRAAVPEMRKVGGGHIITMSSVAYNLVSPYAAIYAASKAFVSSIADSLRLELEDEHIKVTDFRMGRVASEFNKSRLGLGARRESSVPTMTPEKIANELVKVVERPRNTVYPRLFDRLTVLGNTLFPNIIGRIAKKQYQ